MPERAAFPNHQHDFFKCRTGLIQWLAVPEGTTLARLRLLTVAEQSGHCADS
jgi:hypothetical protein